MPLLFAALEKEGEEDLVESLSYVDGDVVDAILEGALLELGLLVFHHGTVGGGDF